MFIFRCSPWFPFWGLFLAPLFPKYFFGRGSIFGVIPGTQKWARKSGKKRGRMISIGELFCVGVMSKRPLYINLDETAVGMAMPSLRRLVLGKHQWNQWRQQGNPKSYDDPRVHDNPQCKPSATPAAIFPCKQEMLNADRLTCSGYFAWTGYISPAQKCLEHWFSDGPDSAEIGKGCRAVPRYFPANLGTGCCQNSFDCRGHSSCFWSQWLQVVPTLCTHLLQPCDTHCFSAYKPYLKQRYPAAKDCSGSVGMSQWLQVLVQLCSNFLIRDWNQAFDQTGLLGDRTKLLRELQPYATHVRDGPMEEWKAFCLKGKGLIISNLLEMPLT